MKKIIAITNPFVVKQTVYVYEDGNKININEPKMEDLENTILSFSKDYDIKDITLIGSKQYNKGIEKRLKEQELSKYNKSELNIVMN